MDKNKWNGPQNIPAATGNPFSDIVLSWGSASYSMIAG
jgi:hypothetical protein